MRRLLRPLWILLALVFLFEAWLWAQLSPLVAAAVRLIAWRELRAWLAFRIQHLPPVATLFVFLIPIVLLLPLKFLGLWMLARGFWLGALAVLGAAKIVSMGVTAFIFDLTRPKLLQLAWFRWVYGHVLSWLERAHKLIDPIKREVSAWIGDAMTAIRLRMRWLTGSGRLLRRIARLRRRMRVPSHSAK